jgi:uncharacterized protein YjiS (DUF1127 family)
MPCRSIRRVGKLMAQLRWPSLWRFLMAWRAKQAIAALQALDERMLKDIGIERSEIESVVRHFGRDPSRVQRT